MYPKQARHFCSLTGEATKETEFPGKNRRFLQPTKMKPILRTIGIVVADNRIISAEIIPDTFRQRDFSASRSAGNPDDYCVHMLPVFFHYSSSSGGCQYLQNIRPGFYT